MPGRTLIALAAAAAAAAAVSPAQAQTAPQAAPQTATPQTADRAQLAKQLDEGFDRVDTNNDGFLSREEINAAGAKSLQQAQQGFDEKVQQEFNRLDSDKNGQLSLAEFKAAAKLKTSVTPDQTLQRLDANKDGRVSAAEFKDRTLAAFDQLDLNKDGMDTPDEQAKARAR